MVSAPGLGLAAVPVFDRTQHGIPLVTLHLPAMHGTETGPGKGPQVLSAASTSPWRTVVGSTSKPRAVARMPHTNLRLMN
jgi:hypothetical protein